MIQELDPKQLAEDFQAARENRTVDPQCERVLGDGRQCPDLATEEVDGDLYCRAHAAED